MTMSNMRERYVLKAYRRKDEMGGGWRGVVVDCAAKRRVASSEVLATREEARDFAKIAAHELMGGRPYRLANVYARYCGGGYRSHLWDWA